MIEFDITRAQWRADYFEQKPRHFPGALKARPVSWSDIDQMLHVIEPGLPVMRMFHNGPLPDNAYTEDASDPGRSRRRLNKSRFYEFLNAGATLQINWLERHSVAAKRLCLEVGRFAGTQTSANAYLSFSGDGTFGEHWDTHDVFAVQMIGRKQWRIFPPTFPLPLTYQTHDRSGHQCPAEPAIEMVMEEGDVLYLPRGWWHHVIPLEVGSFHVSVGCYLPTMFDYIVQTAAKYLEHHPGSRRGFTPTDYEETVEDAVAKLTAVLRDPANAAGFERDWIARETMSAEFNLASLDKAAAPLSDDALLSLATFRSRGLEGPMLPVNGGHLQMEPVSQAIVAALAERNAMPLRELCAHLGDVPAEAVRKAVIDLARHDVVNIQV